jgi:hypothetical protein|tara:strand:+ start:670 stop:1089 length:420 start_codon:yes stop_codon:yes gene_type:complete
MPYKPDRMKFDRTPKPVELHVNMKCTICSLVNNDDCKDHDGGVELIDITVVGVPWAKRNYIKSQCISFDDNQNTHFDSQQYTNECLKIMVKEAPWGVTDDIFLIQIGDELGAALEGILPKIGEEQNKDTGETFSDIKKE